MTDDVVAELDDWLAREATTLKHYPANDVDTGLLQRARDEIVALRQRCALHDDLEFVSKNELTQARAEALEEAAQVCELSAEIMQPDERRLGDAIAAVKSCAAAIRKLEG